MGIPGGTSSLGLDVARESVGEAEQKIVGQPSKVLVNDDSRLPFIPIKESAA